MLLDMSTDANKDFLITFSISWKEGGRGLLSEEYMQNVLSL